MICRIIIRQAWEVKMKTRVAVLFGGKSVEHEVSVISGIQAIMSMDTEKYDITPVYLTKKNEMYVGEEIGNIESYKDIPKLLSSSKRVIMVNKEGRIKLTAFPQRKFAKGFSVEIDVAFPIVHGTNVEDGALQGYLKTIGIPFVGCDVTASAVGMDKYIMKAILKENDVPVLPAKLYTASDYADMNRLISDIEISFGYPVIIKPVNLGSSVGISVAKSRTELTASLDDAFRYSSNVLAEHAISKLREINCAVIGDENEAEASECEEPMHSKDILSYADKYESGGKSGGSKGMAGVSRKIPAELSDKERKNIRDMAVKAFKALRCAGVARIDFMIDEDNGKLYFNEINTIPGSLAFYLFEPIGIPYKELLTRLIESALMRSRREEAITYTFDTNILNGAGFGGNKGGKLKKNK